MYVNLLPNGIRTQIELRSQFRFWSRIGTLTLVLVVMIVGFATWQLVQSRARWQSLLAVCQPVHELESDFVEQSIHLHEADERLAALNRILPQDRSLTLLGMLAVSTQRVNGGITIHRMNAQFNPNTPVTPSSPVRTTEPIAPNKSAIANPSILSLQGVGESDHVVAQFINELQSFNVFASVDLKSSSTANLVDAGRQFHLECRF